MAARKPNPVSFVEREWKPFFDKVEAGRLRRGKTACKQGLVTRIRVEPGLIFGTVKNAGFNQAKGSVQVQLPAPDDWQKYVDDVAVWFGRRPDWLASLFLGQWDPEFLDFVETTGLHLFPNEAVATKMKNEASCTCLDWEKPCQHIAALACRIVSEVTTNPMAALSYVGLDITSVLDESHRVVANRVRRLHAIQELPSSKGEGEGGLWNEERVVFEQLLSRAHELNSVRRIQPRIRVDEVKKKLPH